jgi:hypothetical protein
MKLDDLIKELTDMRMTAGITGDMEVVMVRDDDGASPVADISLTMYNADCTWYGETYPTAEEIAERNDMTMEDDGAPEGAILAVVLGPVN